MLRKHKQNIMIVSKLRHMLYPAHLSGTQKNILGYPKNFTGNPKPQLFVDFVTITT